MPVHIQSLTLTIGGATLRIPKHARLLGVERQSSAAVWLHIMTDELAERPEDDTGWRKFHVAFADSRLPAHFLTASLVGHVPGSNSTTPLFVFEVT